MVMIDIAKKIINIKNEDLLNDIKDDYIEKGFLQLVKLKYINNTS